MSKLDYWDNRLHNWALYFLGNGSLGGCSSIAMMATSAPSWKETTHEIALVGEAIDTDELVQRLRPEQVKTVTAYYGWSGTKELIAVQLGIAIRTLFWRVSGAKDDLTMLQAEARRSVRKINKVKSVALIA